LGAAAAAAGGGGESKQELEVAAREAAGRDLEGEASSEEIEVRVLVLFRCCCVAEGIVAWGVCGVHPRSGFVRSWTAEGRGAAAIGGRLQCSVLWSLQ